MSVSEWATVKALTIATVLPRACRGVAASAVVFLRVDVRIRSPAASNSASRNDRWS